MSVLRRNHVFESIFGLNFIYPQQSLLIVHSTNGPGIRKIERFIIGRRGFLIQSDRSAISSPHRFDVERGIERRLQEPARVTRRRARRRADIRLPCRPFKCMSKRNNGIQVFRFETNEQRVLQDSQ